jgi:hypothetical protein
MFVCCGGACIVWATGFDAGVLVVRVTRVWVKRLWENDKWMVICIIVAVLCGGIRGRLSMKCCCRCMCTKIKGYYLPRVSPILLVMLCVSVLISKFRSCVTEVSTLKFANLQVSQCANLRTVQS